MGPTVGDFDARSTLTGSSLGANERRRIASLLTTATMVLNSHVAVSDVQVVVCGGDSPGKPREDGNFSGEIYGENGRLI